MTESALLKILAEQQMEAEGWISSSQVIHREKSSEYLSSLKDPLIKIIVGVRRCGKSFLSLHSLPPSSWLYVNFDDERLSDLSAEDLNKIYSCGLQLKQNIQYWVFDEIQNIKNWDLFVNRLNRKKLNLVITGSNGKLLSKELSTHLTGRFLSIELFPLSFKEYLSFSLIETTQGRSIPTELEAKIKIKFNEYLRQGGFPETLKLINKGPYLRELYNSILTRDILQRYALRNPTELKSIARLLINNISKEMSYKSLSESTHLGSINTAKKYVSFLNDCYLFFELEAFSPKIRNRITRERKIYAIDTGLYNALQTSVSENLGAQLENFVFLELYRKSLELFYLKEKDFEVDFVILKDRKIQQLIQVCYDMSDVKTENREIRSLIKASEKYFCSHLTILTFEQESEKIVDGKKISIIPVWKWILSSIR